MVHIYVDIRGYIVMNSTISMPDIEVTCTGGHVLQHRFESILFETGQLVERQIHLSKTAISCLITIMTIIVNE